MVDGTCQPGASVSAVARRYRVTTSLLFRWRAALGVGPLPERAKFLSVEVSDSGRASPARPAQANDSVAAPIILERPPLALRSSWSAGGGYASTAMSIRRP